jgi:hypothetical protein
MTAPSQTPQRSPAGYSTDNPWGPLADFGEPNPFMYQTLEDDLFSAFAADGPWATQASGTGSSVAATNGDGGIWLLTNGTTVNLSSGFKGVVNNFFLPPQTFSGSGLTATLFPVKKVFFMARMAIPVIAGFSFTAGLVPQSYASGNPTDGVVIQMAAGGAMMNLNAYSGSVLQWSIPFPAALLAGGANAVIANNQWFDIGFYIDRLLNVYGMLGFPLFGWLPAQAWTGLNNVNAQPVPKAKVCSFQGVYNGQIVTPWTPTAAGLTPTITTFGSGLTSQVDFIMASKER